MPQYPLTWVPGGTCCFTISLNEPDNDLLVRHFDVLRRAMALTRARHPLRFNAWVVLPDHMHCLWTLPRGDRNHACRWAMLKHQFTRNLPVHEALGRRRRAGVWQRQQRESFIRDNADFRHHYDAIHLAPVKLGWARHARDWPYSSVHHAVRSGIYPAGWTGHVDLDGT